MRITTTLLHEFLLGLVICTCVFMLTACRRSHTPPNADTGPADAGKAALTTPPFSTKEPDRYQAIRITTFTGTGSTGKASSSQTNQVLIARDGEKRREEYSAGASGQIVYLEIPGGRFIVLPANRLYADLGTASQAPHQVIKVLTCHASPVLSSTNS